MQFDYDAFIAGVHGLYDGAAGLHAAEDVLLRLIDTCAQLRNVTDDRLQARADDLLRQAGDRLDSLRSLEENTRALAETLREWTETIEEALRASGAAE